MKINENDFFRHATLLICSSLDIETVLRALHEISWEITCRSQACFSIALNLS
jgi:hypothetical protein